MAQRHHNFIARWTLSGPAVWPGRWRHATILYGAALRSRWGDESCLNQCRISEELRIASLCARPVPLASRPMAEAESRACREDEATGSERGRKA